MHKVTRKEIFYFKRLYNMKYEPYLLFKLKKEMFKKEKKF